MMRTILPAHILAGALALVFGYVALYAAKGGAVHRKSGRLFAGAMMTMALSGALMALVTASATSVVAGLLTFYFVTTALLTVRRQSEPYWVDGAAMLFAVAVAIFGFATGFEMARRGRAEAAPMFVFGAVGLLAAAGDLRMIRARGIQGPQRIARHLWRMCFAMWVAAASFFWGPPGRVPEIINIPLLLPIPVLTPIVAMLYWLWRIRIRRSVRGIVRLDTPEAA